MGGRYPDMIHPATRNDALYQHHVTSEVTDPTARLNRIKQSWFTVEKIDATTFSFAEYGQWMKLFIPFHWIRTQPTFRHWTWNCQHSYLGHFAHITAHKRHQHARSLGSHRKSRPVFRHLDSSGRERLVTRGLCEGRGRDSRVSPRTTLHCGTTTRVQDRELSPSKMPTDLANH